MQLPYDKCVKIDQEVDALLEEEKKRQQLNERKAKLMIDGGHVNENILYFGLFHKTLMVLKATDINQTQMQGQCTIDLVHQNYCSG
jgi:hypothetical protein